MPRAPLRYFKSMRLLVPRKGFKLEGKIRGIYVLHKKKQGRDKYEVVYIGRSEANVGSRLHDHSRSKKLGRKWDHFSVYEVHNNISDEEIRELETFILFIYRKDPRVNPENDLKSSKKFWAIKRVSLGS